MKEYSIKKPAAMVGYPIHQAIAALVDGKPHIWLDHGETISLRTAAKLDNPGRDLPSFKEGEVRLFNLKASVSTQVRGKKFYPKPGDHEARNKWLLKKGLLHGFEVINSTNFSKSVQITDLKNRNFSMDSTTFSGSLKVKDVALFQAALEAGVGSTGKAFGFSFLTI